MTEDERAAHPTSDAVGDELAVVRSAAEVVLDAQVAGEDPEAARRALRQAARAALDAGHPLAAIARAEALGERAARERLRAGVLRTVERSAKKLRDATTEHEAAVAQAAAIGLAGREIAARAGVSHGTIAAIVRRHGDQRHPSPARASGDGADPGASGADGRADTGHVSAG